MCIGRLSGAGDEDEFALRKRCISLSTGKSFVDWFVLRQFHITGTNYGLTLLANNEVRAKMGLAGHTAETSRLKDWFQLLYDGFFSLRVSKGAMKRNCANE